MSNGKKKQDGVPISVRFSDEDHEALAAIAAQTGWNISQLARLGAKNLIQEVEKTGVLPLPKVDLSTSGKASVAA